MRRLRSRMGVLRGIARVDGQVVVEGTMTFALGRARTERRRTVQSRAPQSSTPPTFAARDSHTGQLDSGSR